MGRGTRNFTSGFAPIAFILGATFARMSVCRTCGHEIDWTQDESGRFVPLDPEPVFVIEGDGNDKFYTGENAAIVGRIASPEEESPELPVAFVPHWKTCGRGMRSCNVNSACSVFLN